MLKLTVGIVSLSIAAGLFVGMHLPHIWKHQAEREFCLRTNNKYLTRLCELGLPSGTTSGLFSVNNVVEGIGKVITAAEARSNQKMVDLDKIFDFDFASVLLLSNGFTKEANFLAAKVQKLKLQ
jgi:hypothetical protein